MFRRFPLDGKLKKLGELVDMGDVDSYMLCSSSYDENLALENWGTCEKWRIWGSPQSARVSI